MTNQLIPFANNLTPGQNIESYLRTVQTLPQLSADEERELAEKLYHHKDLNAARQLILSSLRYVVPIARSYNGYGLPLNDLIQEGNIGLMKAVKRFNPAEKVRLMTFAVHWVRAEINEYVIKNWRIVKTATTKAQRKLFFKLRSTKKSLEWLGDKDADTIAKELGVTRKDVLEMETRLYGQDMSVDLTPDEEENTSKTYPVLVSQELDPETQLANDSQSDHELGRMHQALKQLDQRSRDILQQRWLSENKTGLKALSEKYGVSMERIRQIEQQAIKTLHASMTA
ncbi:RNA polymerase sigma factor RpoH [Hydrogenovibrio crunogenus]|uniref:RNA polymerase sigma factor RpoH n=1 Tax=Hydrogenovibrio crunogenus TaxID=39765 RepID=A0A4V1C953_9GAMM|nr:RNA polymerase sigma factor RpoH [Hydrogenovibrio crunogenus]QBZ84204.1 RNA polymerase sigma factor RpoH [Hydrogenovibrio crunogenus]RUM92469.1 MAG: RNA polymerase sigma factor RpoH [Thiomicrospira sp.]